LIARQRDYCSADTRLLNPEELRQLLLSLPEIQAELGR
jgi:hypothetical protein